MTTWQPIATAPKDGTYVLLFCPDAEDIWQVSIGTFLTCDDPDETDGSWWPHDENSESLDVDPSHWMPLPQPPVTP